MKGTEHRARAALGALVLALMSLSAEGGDLRAFGPQSYEQILKAHRDRPFVLVFWSVDCAPCHQELTLLANIAAENPSLELVLVSTDRRGIAPQVTATLAEHGLGRVEAWLFDGTPERLRRTVDATWYGTVPRTYLFDPAHRRRTVSGALPRASLESWLREQPR
ncbi:MAG: TlpA family protein disulfide reductase [Gammaproteobacteria bacterium]|nr:TlpA family protein disulfide reductase [Gammaproteobacteria bacterium]NIR99247.1 TlpA family protein disulfide reductase [Gammaproteobacteria bacterium]NIT64868.1 TlpA family protein disulfide reductase [Gammaproteobacteria bacterium]NIV21818.1 TlpA family protein disulfide reductase [Gammaproteobacteria bacterium]NIX10887.1 TlpA family protein disulfide reductase [Gammaproteobacteria bacterium]